LFLIQANQKPGYLKLYLFKENRETGIMVFDQLKNSFDDAVERTKDAVKSVEDATEGKDEGQLESEYEKEMNGLVQEYKQQVVKTIFLHLDNQEFEKAERIAREEGGANDEGWSVIVQTYVRHRLKRGQIKLKIIEGQLLKAEKILEMAKDAGSIHGFKLRIKEAIKYYRKIEQDEILEAQRDISRSENTFKHFGSQTNGRKIFKKEHRDVNRLDKDVKQVEKDLQQLLDKLEG